MNLDLLTTQMVALPIDERYCFINKSINEGYHCISRDMGLKATIIPIIEELIILSQLPQYLKNELHKGLMSLYALREHCKRTYMYSKKRYTNHHARILRVPFGGQNGKTHH